jgi:uncharacterized protein (TIGR02466 family)
MIIHQLFPEPAYFSKLDRTLTKKELKTINEYKKNPYKNEGNTTSNNNYVLENKTLKNLKKDLHTKIMDYFDKVICTDSLITPYITQSWINYTKRDQFHHKHNHPNSLVSGIFYISADKKVDSVTFYKVSLDDRIKLNIAKYNIFNSSSCKFPVETGNIFLFRSSLLHGVEKKKGNNERLSLSFNIFIKGTVGNKAELTELILE